MADQLNAMASPERPPSRAESTDIGIKTKVITYKFWITLKQGRKVLGRNLIDIIILILDNSTAHNTNMKGNYEVPVVP